MATTTPADSCQNQALPSRPFPTIGSRMLGSLVQAMAELPEEDPAPSWIGFEQAEPSDSRYPAAGPWIRPR